jgi:glutaminase
MHVLIVTLVVCGVHHVCNGILRRRSQMLKAGDAFMVLSLVAIAQAFTTLWALKRVGSQRLSNPPETSDLATGRHTH